VNTRPVSSLLDHPGVRAFLSKRLLCEVKTDEKRIALTFDDGPSPRWTPPLLDMLGRKQIRATFFVVGFKVRLHGDILGRTADEGHEIGNHTYTHVPLSVQPSVLIRREISTTERLITDVTGRRPHFLRPPMGWFNNRVLRVVREMGYEPVIGSIHPRDSRKPPAHVILARMRWRIEPGAIIILHDGGRRDTADRSRSVEAADRITDELLEAGYRFETLSELVG
jgi:peptidoglycan/xylan/chitin deacetylase (PgdA/CDA1 family)